MLSNDVFYDDKYVCYIHVCLQKVGAPKNWLKNIKNPTLLVTNLHSQVSNSNLRGILSPLTGK